MKKPLEWLKPTDKLKAAPCSGFFKNINRYINVDLEKHGVILLKSRSRHKAVVVHPSCYEEALELKTLFKHLQDELRKHEKRKNTD